MKPSMSYRRVIVLAALLLAHSPASSWSDVPTPHLTSAIGQERSDADSETLGREIEKFRTCRMPLREAIAIVLEAYAGANIVDIGFDGSSATCLYRVKALYLGEMWDGTVDADRGVIADGSRLIPLKELMEEDRGKLAALRRVGPGMSEAIMVAEKASSGKAIGGGLGDDNGKLVFEIFVLSDTGLKKV